MSEITSAGERCQPPACTLSPDRLRDRKALIDELLGRALTRLTAIPDGVQARFVTQPGLKADLDALVALEARCCASLSFTVTDADDAIVLEVTGAPETHALIAELLTDRAAAMTDGDR